MKKYLLPLPLLLLFSVALHGQSVKFGDLVYYTSMNNTEVYETLRHGSAFRQDYSEEVNGQELEYFKSIGAKPNSEKIITGSFIKLYNGSILRTLDYSSTNIEDILNMVSQAKRYGLDMQFRGADNVNNIYLFDNSYFLVTIFVRRDQASGMVEIKQKEYMNVD